MPVTSGTLANGQGWAFKGRSRAAAGNSLEMALSSCFEDDAPSKALSV